MRPIRRYLVFFPEGTNTTDQTAALEARYGFTDSITTSRFDGFSAELTPQQVAALRCEPVVVRIAYDGVGGPANGS